jgi:hypothetical protein
MPGSLATDEKQKKPAIQFPETAGEVRRSLLLLPYATDAERRETDANNFSAAH